MSHFGYLTFGIMIGVVFALGIYELRDAVNRTESARLAEWCGYEPHPISDVAWELYDRGQIPAGTALYFTRMVNSANIPAAECIEAQL